MSRLKHTNVDALSRNPVGPTTNDDDFNEEIQDIGLPWTLQDHYLKPS
jgi:hypothetical protein